MTDWISVKDQLPNEFQSVIIKTDCPDCPIAQAIFAGGSFACPVICQCDEHYDTDEKIQGIIKFSQDTNTMEAYADRITHWMPYLDVPITR